ncbi:hypothetical protein [Streptomyces californicus]|uniref:hypothetical protein n=1 Tax=Streptomyces californicus TaxID=67351 RepID=UPI001E42CC96|nr:hypothetical protein [Streptomyces californicus]MCC0575303.1 hypothetical protein [Streptomyces californicus]
MPGRDARATSEVAPSIQAPSGIWLTHGKDGRLTLYVHSADGLRRWTQERAGGSRWTVADIATGGSLGHLTVVQDTHGYVHFVGRRERTSGSIPAVDIVYAIQYQTGRPVTAWRSLGNPHKDAPGGHRVGVPDAAVSASGEVHIVLRNAGGGLMLRRERPDGTWRGWEDLKGARMEGDPVAVALASGAVEFFAAVEGGTLYWQQKEAGGDWHEAQPSRLAVLAGTTAALETAPGRATYYWTDPAGGVVGFRAGAWPMALGGAPGGGPHAAIRVAVDGYDCTVLAHQGADGTAAVGLGVTENEANGVWWSDTGVRCLGTPALALDGRGMMVMAVVGEDGEPRMARQTEGPGLTLDDWRTV